MGGHSHWSQIKRQKGGNDVKRGQIFTKVSREITVSAREGGADPAMNPRLRLAVDKARYENMPADTIKRAIERGAGGSEGAALEEITFEGYGPGGVAILVQTLTDNRNRTVSELRSVFTRAGGNLGEAGSVSWIFESRGVLHINPGSQDPEEVELAVIDAGAEDVNAEEGAIEAYTQPQDLEKVKKGLEEAGIQVEEADVVMQPKTTVFLNEKEAVQAMRLVQRLEELDDVQKVYFNADFEAEVAEKLQAAS